MAENNAVLASDSVTPVVCRCGVALEARWAYCPVCGWAPRERVCLGCRGSFLPHDPRQGFCTPACANADRQRRWRVRVAG